MSKWNNSNHENGCHSISKIKILDYVLNFDNYGYHNEINKKNEFVDDACINEIASCITDSTAILIKFIFK